MTETDIIIRNYKRFGILSGSLLIISCIIYSLIQLSINKTISDTLFISLTLGESLFVLYAGYRILLFIVRNEVIFNSSNISTVSPSFSAKEYSNLINIFNNFKVILAIILIWATIMGLMPIIQKYWAASSILNIYYGIFLFFTNIITSYFLIVLLLFFRLSGRLWNLVHVELWKRKNISAKFLFRLTKIIVFVAAIYMASSLTAWLTSPKVPFGPEIFVFIIFSILLLIGCIILPSMPYIRKVSNLKNEALTEMDSKIQDEYQNIIKTLQEKDADVSFNRMNSLIEMRQRIESINVFPFRLETISASLSIILISLLPVIIEYIFKIILKISF
jgi:hypothetical protein